MPAIQGEMNRLRPNFERRATTSSGRILRPFRYSGSDAIGHAERQAHSGRRTSEQSSAMPSRAGGAGSSSAPQAAARTGAIMIEREVKDACLFQCRKRVAEGLEVRHQAHRRRLKACPNLSESALIHRSARGSQFVSVRYSERPAECGVRASVGTTGHSFDDALAETIYGLYKTEVIRRSGSWRSVEAVGYATLIWVDRFNNRRLLAPIGVVPPGDNEQEYYRLQQSHALPARLSINSLRRTQSGSWRTFV